MNFKLALERLNKLAESYGTRLDNADLVIVVQNPGTVGGTPAVSVLDIHTGIDWDANKVMLTTEQDLTLLSKVESLAILESVRLGSSWHAYQTQKQLKDRITSLEQELAQLKSTPHTPNTQPH